jgi:hypothetical protein
MFFAEEPVRDAGLSWLIQNVRNCRNVKGNSEGGEVAELVNSVTCFSKLPRIAPVPLRQPVARIGTGGPEKPGAFSFPNLKG